MGGKWEVGGRNAEVGGDQGRSRLVKVDQGGLGEPPRRQDAKGWIGGPQIRAGRESRPKAARREGSVATGKHRGRRGLIELDQGQSRWIKADQGEVKVGGVAGLRQDGPPSPPSESAAAAVLMDAAASTLRARWRETCRSDPVSKNASAGRGLVKNAGIAAAEEIRVVPGESGWRVADLGRLKAELRTLPQRRADEFISQTPRRMRDRQMFHFC
jgi:hypothetical protein